MKIPNGWGECPMTIVINSYCKQINPKNIHHWLEKRDIDRVQDGYGYTDNNPIPITQLNIIHIKILKVWS